MLTNTVSRKVETERGCLMGFTSDKVHESKRMWENGPSRQFSLTRSSASWTPCATGGYVGMYVCDTCKKPVSGIYGAGRGPWVCADCRRRAKPLPPSGKGHGKTKASNRQEAP